MRVVPPHRPTSSDRPWLQPPGRIAALRPLVSAGFVIVLLLFVASGIDLLQRLREADTRATDAWSAFQRSEEALGTVRFNVLHASIVARDALLDTDRLRWADYRLQMQAAHDACERALADYPIALDSSSEGQPLLTLKSSVTQFWDTLMPLVDVDRPYDIRTARRVLEDTLLPRRELVVTITSQIRALNRLALQRQQAASAEATRTAQGRAWSISGLVLILSLVVAVVVAKYAGHLERQLRHQLDLDDQNTRALQLLSSRLVRAQEEERQQIARELHDEVGQALTAVKMGIHSAQRQSSPEAQAAALAEVRGIADGALQSIRHLSQLLRPPMLETLGLPATIEWYLHGFASRTGIRAHVVQDANAARCSPEIETCVYRVVQEATTNVARHAEAQTVTVTVTRQAETLQVVIEDDGKGFDPTAPRPVIRGGVGLLGMAERVAGFRGQLSIDSAPGCGTRITVALPAVIEKDSTDGQVVVGG